jgi:Secretion system C-terminal sorting domain
MIKSQFIILTIIVFWGYMHLHAQSGPVGSGGNASGSGGSVSYSIGQTDYLVPTGSGGNANEGLQQPYEIFTAGINDENISLELSIYPNPTVASVFLKIDKEDLSKLHYQLNDANGAQLWSYKIADKTTEIDMAQLASGAYFIHVIYSNTILQTFKIIKK